MGVAPALQRRQSGRSLHMQALHAANGNPAGPDRLVKGVLKPRIRLTAASQQNQHTSSGTRNDLRPHWFGLDQASLGLNNMGGRATLMAGSYASEPELD